MNDDGNIDVTEIIKSEIQKNNVVLFMKGTSVFPMCGFSAAVAQILKDIGIKYSSVNVLESDEMREGIKKFSNWPTIPQLYIKEEFIGGCDIVKHIKPKELRNLFASKNIVHIERIFKKTFKNFHSKKK